MGALIQRGCRAEIFLCADALHSNVRGKLDNCRITSQKQKADRTYLQAQCATDIAAGSSQLALRLDSNAELTRFFSGYVGHGYELFSLHTDELAF